MAALVTRLAGMAARAALKTDRCIPETSRAGLENRQRHAASRCERSGSRFADIDAGEDGVLSDMATLWDRLCCVELALRELAGALPRPRQGAVIRLAGAHEPSLEPPRRLKGSCDSSSAGLTRLMWGT